MNNLQYQAFSLRMHEKNWQRKRASVCQFELTFACNLHCRHCYSDCFNKPSQINKELNIKQVRLVLDQLYAAGIIWLCFSGGDPLVRDDFLDIYSYAKDKGFIITIFTNGYAMTKEIAFYLKERPPFAIELTLNAVSQSLFDDISQVKGSFRKVMQGLGLTLGARLPLKIKTQVTKDNFKHLPHIKKFVNKLGMVFRPSIFLHARLNGDLAPCKLRITPRQVLQLDGKRPSLSEATRCQLGARHSGTERDLFPCVIGGGDGINIDPYGNMLPCLCIREPKISALKKDILKAQDEILSWVRTRQSSQANDCASCSIRQLCYSCPGKAWLEKGDLEAKVDWFCEVAKSTVNGFAGR